MTTRVYAFILATFSAAAVSVPLLAHAPSGAIFTTVVDGSEVNANIYPSKDAVYLDGGPGPGAPQTAAGLDDGRYVFQVTDPSGKRLLSTDQARCRQFDVANGIITNVVATGCQHKTGLDVDHGAVTVQLMPYLDTPNPGGVYKVWATLAANYKCSLNVVDCGYKPGVNVHGFAAADSKTDNFKVKNAVAQEIDTRFFIDANGNNYLDDGETVIDGAQILWTDTLGAQNTKSSYYRQSLNVNHEAHIEAPEDGTHRIAILPQAGCNIGVVDVGGVRQPETGPQEVTVQFPKTTKSLTIFVTVQCVP
ncbi:MAG TPA: hypothetical protein VKD69_25165 [Vicinamibacterales bacterium]|nr:hypothetical protein [Vicinamibacterales bacterium]